VTLSDLLFSFWIYLWPSPLEFTCDLYILDLPVTFVFFYLLLATTFRIYQEPSPFGFTFDLHILNLTCDLDPLITMETSTYDDVTSPSKALQMKQKMKLRIPPPLVSH